MHPLERFELRSEETQGLIGRIVSERHENEAAPTVRMNNVAGKVLTIRGPVENGRYLVGRTCSLICPCLIQRSEYAERDGRDCRSKRDIHGRVCFNVLKCRVLKRGGVTTPRSLWKP